MVTRAEVDSIVDRAVRRGMEVADLKATAAIEALRTEIAKSRADNLKSVDDRISACQKRQSGTRRYWFTTGVSILAFLVSIFAMTKDTKTETLERRSHDDPTGHIGQRDHRTTKRAVRDDQDDTSQKGRTGNGD